VAVGRAMPWVDGANAFVDARDVARRMAMDERFMMAVFKGAV
jgi:hypothetical protein